MLFTIAIPTYNNENTIRAAIESAVNQEYKEKYEVLVLNNNCSDKTEDILTCFADRIKVIKNNVTVSMWENHNLCFQYAEGDYLVICHADDQLLPDALEKYYNILEKRNFPEKYVLWGRSMFRDFYRHWSKGGFLLNQIAAGSNSLKAFQVAGITPSGTCYSRSSFLNEGGFVAPKHDLAPGDWITLWKLAICFFEFEMSDRIFIKRNFATTASGVRFCYENVRNSKSEAIKCLFDTLNKEQKDFLIDFFTNSPSRNPYLLNLFIENNYLTKSGLKIKILKDILKQPYKLRNIEYRKLLFTK